MKRFFVFLIAFLSAIVFIVPLSLVMAFPTMWLWNWLMPEIFALKVITFWQALGINVFSGMLFRSSTNFSNNKENKYKEKYDE